MLKLEQVIEAARELAESLHSDISLCATREEHIRVTTRANSAAGIVWCWRSYYLSLSLKNYAVYQAQLLGNLITSSL